MADLGRFASVFVVLSALLAPSVALSFGTGSQESSGAAQPGGDEDRELVRKVFDAYRSALIEGDGRSAVEMVDEQTFAYFTELRTLALEGTREQLEERRFVEKLLIVTLREMLDVDDLRRLSLEGLITRATGEGWLSAEAVTQLKIGNVTVEGDRARAEALSASGESLASTGLDDLHYTFRRERGSWKFEFASLVASLDALVTSFTKQLGTEDEQLIFMLVEGLTGQAVLPTVWQPPAASRADGEETHDG